MFYSQGISVQEEEKVNELTGETVLPHHERNMNLQSPHFIPEYEIFLHQISP